MATEEGAAVGLGTAAVWVHMGFQRESGQGDVQKAEGQRIQVHLEQNI